MLLGYNPLLLTAPFAMIAFDRLPAKNDPRLPVLLLQATFVTCGITFWGFNRSPAQVGLILLICVTLDCLLHYLLRRKTLLVPISGLITGLGLSVLTNFSHGLWLAAIPPFFATASKYVFTVNGRHIYNPGLFGVIAALVLSDGMITPAPAYQWGGDHGLFYRHCRADAVCPQYPPQRVNQLLFAVLRPATVAARLAAPPPYSAANALYGRVFLAGVLPVHLLYDYRPAHLRRIAERAGVYGVFHRFR